MDKLAYKYVHIENMTPGFIQEIRDQGLDKGLWFVTLKMDGTNLQVAVDQEGNVTYGSRNQVLGRYDQFNNYQHVAARDNLSEKVLLLKANAERTCLSGIMDKGPIAIVVFGELIGGIHGDGGSCEDWTDAPEQTDLGEIRFCTVYDHIVERHLCDPFLIVGLNNDGMENPLYAEKLVKETILPHLARSYSTWMEGDGYEQIAAAREHIAIGGLSRGSIYTYTFGMTRCLDVAANFCCFSNGYTTDVTRRLRSEELKELDYRSYIATVGLKDDYYTVRGHRHCYSTLCRSLDALTDGENARFFEIDAGHNFLTWTASLYDALQLMF